MTTTAPGTDADRSLPSASDLTFDEQAALTAGADMWHTAGVDRLGLPGIGVTDGPSGARGTQFTGTTSTSLPCGTALASTWNRELIGRVGRLLGDEARARGASVLLAPTVNIHRHPLAGRNFECYSEDPYLTAEIAVAFIEGVQSRGVGCAVKHFVCNDQETDRMAIDVVVDERARREIYLLPFEAAVRRAGAWAVMAAYNRIDGRTCSEHRGLLTDLLRDEWASTVWSCPTGSAHHRGPGRRADLEMPGPGAVLGHHLGAAIERETSPSGRSSRLLSGCSTSSSAPPPVSGGSTTGDAPTAQLPLAAATEAIVLLANDGCSR
jgi:beta-glucosidase